MKLTAAPCSCLMAALIMAFAPTGAHAAAASKKTPGAVTATCIKAKACNKVTIKWERTSNITNYRIYYRQKSGSSWGSWVLISTVGKGTTSYTHVSSDRYPLKANTACQYSVRGYNKTYKTIGHYNALTVRTLDHSDVSKTAKRAACTASGRSVSTCRYCGRKVTKTIAPLGHAWEIDPNNYAGVVCTACGFQTTDMEEMDMHSAAYGHGYTEGGAGGCHWMYTCSRCGEHAGSHNDFVDHCDYPEPYFY